MKSKKSKVYNSEFYNNLLSNIRNRYDFDETVSSFEDMLFDVLREMGHEDEVKEIVQFMPEWFKAELVEMYNDNE